MESRGDIVRCCCEDPACNHQFLAVPQSKQDYAKCPKCGRDCFVHVPKPWPEDCVQRAFVAGAKWWEFHKTGGTMWDSDINVAEDEAVRRYGEP